MTTTASLETSLRRIHDYAREALTSDHAARIFARDLEANTRGLAPTLRKLGGRVAWLDRDPLAPDGRAWVVASLDDSTGLLRFDQATAAGVRGLPVADSFDAEGRWIG